MAKLNIDSEIRDIIKKLDNIDQQMNNHISMFHQDGIQYLLDQVTDKCRNLKIYVDILKNHNAKNRTKIREIVVIEKTIKNILDEVKLDSARKLQYPLKEQFNPPKYLEYYLVTVCPYLLDKISLLRECEKKLSRFKS